MSTYQNWLEKPYQDAMRDGDEAIAASEAACDAINELAKTDEAGAIAELLRMLRKGGITTADIIEHLTCGDDKFSRAFDRVALDEARDSADCGHDYD